MASFANSWGILLYRFVTSNVTKSVLGSIFSGMEFLKSIYLILFCLEKVMVKCPLVC